jgi:hypothetical protein
MKRANLPFGSPPPQREPDARRPGESHTRLATTRQLERRATPRRPPPAAEAGMRRPKHVADSEEPRTGVVRRIDVPNARVRPSPAPTAAVPVARRADSRAHDEPSPAAAPKSSAPPRDHQQHGSARDDARAWRCLEWGQLTIAKERRPRRDPKVSIAQLSAAGELVRHSGPETSLPETGEFMHKMASLIAQGFGFARCHSVCLKAQDTALSVSEVGDARVMAVSGPLRSMNNVLRRAGLQ